MGCSRGVPPTRCGAFVSSGIDRQVNLIEGDLIDLSSLIRAMETSARGRGLQPGRAELRRDLLAATPAHRAGDGVGGDVRARSDSARQSRGPLLSGFEQRDVRQDPRPDPGREHHLPPAQSVWGCQAVRSLDHRELPRKLRHPCLQRNPVQPRIAAARHSNSSPAR